MSRPPLFYSALYLLLSSFPPNSKNITFCLSVQNMITLKQLDRFELSLHLQSDCAISLTEPWVSIFCNSNSCNQVHFDLHYSTVLTGSLLMNHERLLILSCSQRKSHKEGLLPAIERYDGPLFRVLRRYWKTQDTRNQKTESKLDTYVLSAEFGLISAEYPTPYYDCCMTRHRAQILHPVVVDKLKNLLTGGCRFQELFICLGQAYWPALEGWEAFVHRDMAVHVAWGDWNEAKSALQMAVWHAPACICSEQARENQFSWGYC